MNCENLLATERRNANNNFATEKRRKFISHFFRLKSKGKMALTNCGVGGDADYHRARYNDAGARHFSADLPSPTSTYKIVSAKMPHLMNIRTKTYRAPSPPRLANAETYRSSVVERRRNLKTSVSEVELILSPESSDDGESASRLNSFNNSCYGSSCYGSRSRVMLNNNNNNKNETRSIDNKSNRSKKNNKIREENKEKTTNFNFDDELSTANLIVTNENDGMDGLPTVKRLSNFLLNPTKSSTLPAIPRIPVSSFCSGNSSSSNSTSSEIRYDTNTRQNYRDIIVTRKNENKITKSMVGEAEEVFKRSPAVEVVETVEKRRHIANALKSSRSTSDALNEHDPITVTNAEHHKALLLLSSSSADSERSYAEDVVVDKPTTISSRLGDATLTSNCNAKTMTTTTNGKCACANDATEKIARTTINSTTKVPTAPPPPSSSKNETEYAQFYRKFEERQHRRKISTQKSDETLINSSAPSTVSSGCQTAAVYKHNTKPSIELLKARALRLSVDDLKKATLRSVGPPHVKCGIDMGRIVLVDSSLSNTVADSSNTRVDSLNTLVDSSIQRVDSSIPRVNSFDMTSGSVKKAEAKKKLAATSNSAASRQKNSSPNRIAAAATALDINARDDLMAAIREAGKTRSLKKTPRPARDQD